MRYLITAIAVIFFLCSNKDAVEVCRLTHSANVCNYTIYK